LAISPPSDIVMDVLRAAEPEAVAAAREKLASGRPVNQPGGAEFARLAVARATPFGRASAAATTDAPDQARAAYTQFEAMVLQSFLQSMLPSDNESVYGKGLSGDMWRSLLAQQLGGVMAERGGIGIADRLLAKQYREGDKARSIGPVPQASHRAELDGREMVGSALVHEIQRHIAQSMLGGGKTGK
jgi:Rod binding domain-containing protein